MLSRSRTTSWSVFSAVLVAAALTTSAAAAQTSTGTISGTVLDPQKSIVPGATVTVINEATNDARVAVTDEQGNFQVTNLQPGTLHGPRRARRASARSSARTSC